MNNDERSATASQAWRFLCSGVAALGIAFVALPGASRPAFAFDTLSIADVSRAIGAVEQRPVLVKAGFHGGAQGDAAFAALRDFAKRLGPAPDAGGPAKDSAYAALRDYAGAIDGGRSIAAAPPPASPGAVDGAYAELGAFARSIDGDHPIVLAAVAKPVAKAKPLPGGEEATFVGSKVCLGCHTGQAAAFGDTLMGRIGKTQKGKFECENCHGAGSAHAKAGGGRGVGGIISFRKDDPSRTPAENNAICLTCHERGDRTYWSGSTHETRDVACTECHTVMKAVSVKYNLKTASEPETCFQCHKDRRAQMFRSSHMPLREGKIVCSDCHNPHGSFTEALLRENSVNDNCYKCHAEKRGPFLFEHAPVRENCLSCHDAHGSVNEYLLKVSRPRLCAECHGFGHGLTSGPLAVQTMGRSCQNCHTEVHGTNSPSGALLHR